MCMEVLVYTRFITHHFMEASCSYVLVGCLAGSFYVYSWTLHGTWLDRALRDAYGLGQLSAGLGLWRSVQRHDLPERSIVPPLNLIILIR